MARIATAHVLIHIAIVILFCGCKESKPTLTQNPFVYSDKRVETLVRSLSKYGSDGIESDLYGGWDPDVSSIRELIEQLVQATDADTRYAIEAAINIMTGHTGEDHEASRLVLQKLSNEPNLEIQAVARFMLTPGMLENDHSDEGNLVRLEFCESDVEAVRWLAVRDLSMVHRSYIIESNNDLLFLNVPNTEHQAIDALRHHLKSDSSAAVRLTAIDGLWWYFKHLRVTPAEFEREVNTAVHDADQNVRARGLDYTERLSKQTLDAVQ